MGIKDPIVKDLIPPLKFKVFPQKATYIGTIKLSLKIFTTENPQERIRETSIIPRIEDIKEQFEAVTAYLKTKCKYLNEIKPIINLATLTR